MWLGPFQTAAFFFVPWRMRQPLEFIIAVVRPTEVGSVPGFPGGFSWHLDIDTPSVSHRTAV